MKANRVLTLYAEGRRDFRGLDLQRQVFREKNLSGSDFSGCDIRSTKFENVNLTDSKFNDVLAGIHPVYKSISYIVLLGSGLLSGFISSLLSSLLISEESANFFVGVLSLSAVLVFLLSTRFFGMARALFISAVLYGSFGTLSGIVSVLFDYPGLGEQAISAASTCVLSVGVAGTLIFFLAFVLATINSRRRISTFLSGFSVLAVILVPSFSSHKVAQEIKASSVLLPIMITAFLSLFCFYLAKQSFRENPKFNHVREAVLSISSLLATSFSGSILCKASFCRAKLKNSNFQAKNLDKILLSEAESLDLVMWGKSGLKDTRVQDLLSTRIGSRKIFEGCDLSRTDLSGIDFTEATLKKANLVRANLQETCLERANLALANVTEVDFTRARLSGACIENWTMDSSTIFKGVDCRYVYRREPGEDRHPRTGDFPQGGFERFYQVVLDTVELFFENGIDQSSFEKALSDLQLKYGGTSLKGIEKYGENSFIVKLKTLEEIDKTALSQEFWASYSDALSRLEENHQRQLNFYQHQLDYYHRSNTDLIRALDRITKVQERHENSSDTPKQIILTFWKGSLREGFPVSAELQIDASNFARFPANLSPAPDLEHFYYEWQEMYSRISGISGRVTFKKNNDSSLTNVSLQELYLRGERLKQALNIWLQSHSFRPISDKIREKFLPSDEIRILIQSDDLLLKKLPWNTWDFLNDFSRAEISLGGSKKADKSHRVRNNTDKLRILSVLGDNRDINLEEDRETLEEAFGERADILFLSQPLRQTFFSILRQPEGWDIVSFSGHSKSLIDGDLGVLKLNSKESLTSEELRLAIAKAVEYGLKLALLNSCDGLGFLTQLEQVNIPQAILMKECIPDEVSHAFLKVFLNYFSRGLSVQMSVREAREQLISLEDKFPYASWLPVIFHNSAETPIRWSEVL